MTVYDMGFLERSASALMYLLAAVCLDNQLQVACAHGSNRSFVWQLFAWHLRMKLVDQTRSLAKLLDFPTVLGEGCFLTAEPVH